jgi:hypothetical protein
MQRVRFFLRKNARAHHTRMSREGSRNRKPNNHSRQPSVLWTYIYYCILELLVPWNRILVGDVYSVSCKDTCSRSIYSALTEQGTQQCILREGAGKFLARPRRKQATATKLRIYSAIFPMKLNTLLSPFLSGLLLQAIKKNLKSCLSNQVFAAAMISVSDEKCFYQCREQMIIQRGQIRRIR